MTQEYSTEASWIRSVGWSGEREGAKRNVTLKSANVAFPSGSSAASCFGIRL